MAERGGVHEVCINVSVSLDQLLSPGVFAAMKACLARGREIVVRIIVGSGVRGDKREESDVLINVVPL